MGVQLSSSLVLLVARLQAARRQSMRCNLSLPSSHFHTIANPSCRYMGTLSVKLQLGCPLALLHYRKTLMMGIAH